MMMNCPKCGFSQPEDTYCARCGVDMTAFKPQRKSLVARTLSNLTFQIAAICVALASLFTYVRIQEKLNQNQMTSPANGFENAPSTNQFKTVEAASESAIGSNTPNPRDNQNAKGSRSDEPAESHGSSKSAEGKTAAPDEISPGALKATEGNSSSGLIIERAGPATHVRLVFVEVPRFFLEELENEDPLAARNGGFVTGVISDGASLESRIRNLGSEARVLETTSPTPLTSDPATQIFRGLNDESSNQPLGLTFQIIPIALEDGNSRVQINIERVLRDSLATPPIDVFQPPIRSEFAIPKGAVLFISGLLPRFQLKESDESLYRNSSVLNVMTSEAFQNEATSFLVFVDLK